MNTLTAKLIKAPSVRRRAQILSHHTWRKSGKLEQLEQQIREKTKRIATLNTQNWRLQKRLTDAACVTMKSKVIKKSTNRAS